MAENLPGVVCCLFADSIPGSNTTGIKQDESVLADGKVSFRSYEQVGGSMRSRSLMCPSSVQVTCVGHIIGAVVADTQLHAQRAAKAVKIQYEELQPVITIQVRPGIPDLL